MSESPIITNRFRAWTGKRMIYQDDQYLGSFIRRIVPQIIQDHGGSDWREHESYLPNGGMIDEYLRRFIGLTDKNGKMIYAGDIIRYGLLALNDTAKFGEEPSLPEGTKEDDITTVLRIIEVRDNIDDLHKLKSWLSVNPDVVHGEVIGNVDENPELLGEVTL